MILLKAVSKKDEPLVDAISTRILSLSYEDVDSGQDHLKLEIANDDLALFANPEIFQAEAFVVQWGDPGNLTPPRKISIKEISGFLTFTLTGTGALWKGDFVPVKRIWDQEEVTEIVRKISEEMGYPDPDIQVPEEMTFLTRQQYEPNARFLQRLASEFGYAFWVDSRLHWKSRDAGAVPTRQLVFRGTANANVPGSVIGEPKVKFSFTRSKPQSVKAVSPENKAEAKSKADPSLAPKWYERGGSSSKPRIVGGTYGTLTYTSDSAKAQTFFPEAKMLPAKHEETIYTPSGKPQKAGGVWRGKQDTSEIEVKIVGAGDVVVGCVLELANFGAINDGKWYTRSVKHQQGADGFTQDIKLTRGSGKKVGKGAKDVPGKVNKAAAVGEKGTAGAANPRQTEVRIVPGTYGEFEEVMRDRPSGFTKFVDRYKVEKK